LRTAEREKRKREEARKELEKEKKKRAHHKTRPLFNHKRSPHCELEHILEQLLERPSKTERSGKTSHFQ
jgi:hypothetical protein